MHHRSLLSALRRNSSTRKYLCSHYYNVEKFQWQQRFRERLSEMAKQLLRDCSLRITNFLSAFSLVQFKRTLQHLPRPFNLWWRGKYSGQRQAVLQPVAGQDANDASPVALIWIEKAGRQRAPYSRQRGCAGRLGVDSLVRGKVPHGCQYLPVSDRYRSSA